MLVITEFILKLKRVYKKELTFYGGAKLRKNIHSLFDIFAEKFDALSDTGKNVMKKLIFSEILYYICDLIIDSHEGK
jgi:hypothetical protein